MINSLTLREIKTSQGRYTDEMDFNTEQRAGFYIFACPYVSHGNDLLLGFSRPPVRHLGGSAE